MNSVVQSQLPGGQLIKVRNFQALIDKNYSHSNTFADTQLAADLPMQNNDYSDTAKNPEFAKQMVQLNLRITNKNVTAMVDQNSF